MIFVKETDARTEENQPLLQHSVRNADGTLLEYLTFPLLEKTGIVRHLFSTRLGGVSKGMYASMNLGFTRGDSEEAVMENHKRIADILGCDIGDMTASHQTHTTNIRRITGADRGKGITRERDYTDVDGLITEEPGIVLVTYYADCVPLYFVDPVRRAIGLAPSGWRGTAEKMGACMVKAMHDAFGSRPEALYAAIAPSICRDCYEVSEDVAARFTDLGDDIVLPGKAPGKYQLDLWRANEIVLMEAGVKKERISTTQACTCCHCDLLFSHRASKGRRGNLAALLSII